MSLIPSFFHSSFLSSFISHILLLSLFFHLFFYLLFSHSFTLHSLSLLSYSLTLFKPLTFYLSSLVSSLILLSLHLSYLPLKAFQLPHKPVRTDPNVTLSSQPSATTKTSDLTTSFQHLYLHHNRCVSPSYPIYLSTCLSITAFHSRHKLCSLTPPSVPRFAHTNGWEFSATHFQTAISYERRFSTGLQSYPHNLIFTAQCPI